MSLEASPTPKPVFIVDEAASDNEYFIVEVAGFATVAIKREGEGIVVDIFPLYGDDPVASAYAFDTDIHEAMTPEDADDEVRHG